MAQVVSGGSYLPYPCSAEPCIAPLELRQLGEGVHPGGSISELVYVKGVTLSD